LFGIPRILSAKASVTIVYLKISRPLDSAPQPEPSALVLNESSCYHFRVLDPRVSCNPLRDRRRGNNRLLFPHLSVAAS